MDSERFDIVFPFAKQPNRPRKPSQETKNHKKYKIMKAKVTFYNNGVIAYTTQKDNKLVRTLFFSTSDFVNFCADNGIKTPLSAIETEPEDYEMTF